MANRWCDGFGRYGGTLAYMLNGSSGQAWAQVTAVGSSAGFSLSNENPRTGNWHLRLFSGFGEGVARRVFGAALTEVLLGKAICALNLPNTELSGGDNDAIFLFSLRDATNVVQCSIWLGTDGALEARLGTTTVLGRTIPIIGAGAYQHIEVYAKASNTGTGAIEIRVDEITRLNLTGIDTVTSALVEFSQDACGEAGVGSPGATIDFADFYCNDTTDDGSGCNTFIGDCKSGILMVDADTAQADFDLSAGVSGYPLLNETPPDDGDYIYTASTTGESDFGLEDTPGNLTEILTVRPFVRALKDDAGTCSIAPNMKSSGTKGTVSDQPLATAFSYYDSNVPFDPDTGVPWIKAGLDAASHVVERTA